MLRTEHSRRTSHGLVHAILTTAVCAAAVLMLGSAAKASAAIPPPSSDPFYTYSGSLAGITPGTVLKSRKVEITLPPDLSTPIPATQLLFRTTNEIGHPALAVTTVIQPVTGPALPRILSWQPFYDTLGAQCDPSYELRGGGTTLGAAYFSSCDLLGQAEGLAAASFLSQGDTIVVTDYEDTNEVYGAGQLEGYGTLDGIRAAENYLHYFEPSTPVAMIGYSGGAIASQWAAELAPAYAPRLDVVGTAAGGVFVDPIHNLEYINGGASGWDDVIPVFLIVYQRGFGFNIAPYLSPLGTKIVAEDQTAYINDLTTNGFTRYQQLLKPQYANITDLPGVPQAFNKMTMGSDGIPKSPMLLENGGGLAANGWDGDGIMITADVEALAHEYCEHGVPVDFSTYNLTHVDAFVPFAAQAIPWITSRLLGLTAPIQDCSTIPVGDSLAPIPVPAAHQRRRHHHRKA
jgi:hypothetical protein